LGVGKDSRLRVVEYLLRYSYDLRK
jgi:hypothetical protein